MAIQYTWTIQQLECKPQEDGLTDVVIIVHWQRNAADNQHSASIYGAQQMPAPNPSDFTPYADLTQDQVESWLDATLDVPALDANLAAQIEQQINPPVIVLPLPWQQPTNE